ncbi:MAG: LCP family protein [Solobacterium sp.]|jgi:LCP family protein required for cell wall assembly|nr:LCP family protein [Solobacterium sp.]
MSEKDEETKQDHQDTETVNLPPFHRELYINDIESQEEQQKPEEKTAPVHETKHTGTTGGGNVPPDHPRHRHSKKKDDSRKHKGHKGRIALISIIAAALVIGVCVYGKFHSLHSLLQALPGGLGSVAQETDGGEESSDQDKAALEQSLQDNLNSKKDDSDLSSNLMNIMIVGVDSRDDDFTGRSDAMVICSINEDDGRILMTSLLRDTYVSIPDHGSNRLNAAFAYGGADLLTETIKENYGITVDRTIVVNFIFVKEFVDAIGGIDMDLTSDEITVMNKYISDMNLETFDEPLENDQLTDTTAGTYHLNGKQALAYSRDRYSTGSDFDRTSRQRQVIEKCLDIVKTMSLTDLNSLMEEFLPKIATDLSEGDCAKLLLMLMNVSNYTIDSMSLPVEGTYQSLTVNGMSVIGVDFDANYQYWKDALNGNMPDSSASASASADVQLPTNELPTVTVSDYTKVPAKSTAIENQALAEQYAAHYNTSVQYVTDESKAGICQFYDSSNNLLFAGDTIPSGVIIRYYTAG